MRSIAKHLVWSVPLALFVSACGGSDTYVQPTPQPQPAVTVVQPSPAPAPASTTKVEIEKE